ncbi:hypothetical protein WR25_06259 isoform B [Diploscapter pachys]|uniref:Uncharacterized protein n=1 Tax=Diploscapter pachys TaxID=2018661 RepID=A0A2A2LXD2_9BILA|nr:hypothetical protein WR25_06259 isoform B [Diploscapter pachys]
MHDTYTMRDIISRFEAEEDEFLKELQDMKEVTARAETNEERETQSFIESLFDLVDEIGTLRNQNKLLKSRISSRGSSKSRNVVERVSAIFDASSNILPRLLRSTHQQIRVGAREALSTPPNKNSLSLSTISTDCSSSRLPPIVQPELMDSDIESEKSDMVSPAEKGSYSSSSVSSARESLTSSFLDVFGLRRPDSSSVILRKSKKSNPNKSTHNSNAKKPPRAASHYDRVRDESEESLRREEWRKLDRNTESLKREKVRLGEELEAQKSQMQKMTEEMEAAAEKLENFRKKLPLTLFGAKQKNAENEEAKWKETERRMKEIDANVQRTRVEMMKAHHTLFTSTLHHTSTHRKCLELIEKLQKENFVLLQKKIGETDEGRKALEGLPTYEALFTFTYEVVRRLTETRKKMVEEEEEGRRMEANLLATESTLLITHAQVERMKMKLTSSKKNTFIRRAFSYHGRELGDKEAAGDIGMLLPFKLQASKIENAKRKTRKSHLEGIQRNVEEELLELFAVARAENKRSDVHVRTRVGTCSHNWAKRPLSLIEMEGQTKRHSETRRSIRTGREREERPVSSMVDMTAMNSPLMRRVERKRRDDEEKVIFRREEEEKKRREEGRQHRIQRSSHVHTSKMKQPTQMRIPRRNMGEEGKNGVGTSRPERNEVHGTVRNEVRITLHYL